MTHQTTSSGRAIRTCSVSINVHATYPTFFSLYLGCDMRLTDSMCPKSMSMPSIIM